MFRSFFPNPRLFFLSALAWTAICMIAWFVAGPTLQGLFSLGPMIGIAPTEATPDPFFSSDKVWLYQYILVAGYAFCVPWYWLTDNKRWYWWSVVGSVTIIEIVFFNVQINAWLNDWYGGFYDLIQRALTAPNTITFDEYMIQIFTVAIVLSVSITVVVLNSFLNSHYLFRWRRAMSFYYQANWKHIRTTEGAAQRIQEDTESFSSIVENLGLSFIDSVMTLLVFLPLLWGLSEHITELPWIGAVPGSLVWVALFSAIFGTVLLAVVGIKLPGLQFQNQRVEAAYRKELVYGEDYADRADPLTIRELFLNVQRNYFRLYFHYLYFNVARYAYLQGSVFFPYIAMGPSVVAASLTFGIFQQVLNAFGQVADSFRFLVNSWTTIIRLISVYKRLRGLEDAMPKPPVFANDYDDPRYLNSRVGDAASDGTPPSTDANPPPDAATV